MAAIAFFGYLLLSIGPGVAFFLFFIAPKSFIVLVSLFSAFYWLVVLLVTSALFRGFVPIPAYPSSYVGALVGAVVIEELARYGVWQLHKRCCQVLQRMSRSSGHRFQALDRLYLDLGWGYGHGSAHVLFFFVSLLPLTTGEGTWYNEACPDMNLFLVGALYSLGAGMSLPALMLLGLEGWAQQKAWMVAWTPLMHLAMALTTVAAMQPSGCVVSVALQLALGVINMGVAAAAAWRALKQPRSAVGMGQMTRTAVRDG